MGPPVFCAQMRAAHKENSSLLRLSWQRPEMNRTRAAKRKLPPMMDVTRREIGAPPAKYRHSAVTVWIRPDTAKQRLRTRQVFFKLSPRIPGAPAGKMCRSSSILHHSRAPLSTRSCGVWRGGTRRFVLLDFRLCCMFHPISLVLPKETGWSPKEKRLGWWRPREVSGPTRLSHSRGSCHSAAKVSASRTYFITRPRGEGLGLDVDWRLKVFCPAFLQKSGRGPGAEPWTRAAARGILLC